MSESYAESFLIGDFWGTYGALTNPPRPDVGPACAKTKAFPQ
jgi:hypothetical protein